MIEVSHDFRDLAILSPTPKKATNLFIDAIDDRTCIAVKKNSERYPNPAYKGFVTYKLSAYRQCET